MERRKEFESDLQRELQRSICRVNFVKKNGEERKMLCTQIESMLPETSNPPKDVEGLVTVYDLEVKGWRSFYLETVTDYSIAYGGKA